MNRGLQTVLYTPQSQSQSGSQDFFPMVSHAEVAEPARRASSVASRSRKSSHHGHRNRTQYGGAQLTPQNEFPFFAQTGDIEIIIASDGQEKRYLLHRLILAQFSGFFEAGTRDEWSRAQANQGLHTVGTRLDQQLSLVGEEASSSVSALPITPEQIARGPQPKRRWKYELDWDDVQDDEEPMLVQRPPSHGPLFANTFAPPPPVQSRPPPSTSRNAFFRSMASLSINSPHVPHPSQSAAAIAMPPVDPAATNPLLRDYDNLFRIFYNHSPLLNSINIASAYSECKSLLTLADMYDALPVVGSRVDHHLLRFSSRLFKQIAKYPPSYLKLGYLARSRIIFSEALTHVVGQWPTGFAALKPVDHSGSGYEVPLSVLDLIEDKVEELEEIKSKIEAKLFRLPLTTSRGERVNPSNDYLGWLAMSLWRQWLAENTTPEIRGILKNSPNPAHARNTSRGSNGPQAPSAPQPVRQPPLQNTGRIYRLIGSTDSQCFLPQEELKRFLKLYPTSSSSSSLYSRENLKRFERKIDEIKNVARDIVKPLTRNCLELDIRALSDGQGGGLGYLTCMKLEEGDLPWD